MENILSGKELAVNYRKQLKENICEKVNKGIRPPSLVSIVVGEDGGSISYARGQQRVSNEVGIKYEIKIFSEEITQEELIEEINKLNNDSSVDGVIIELPLPSKFEEGKVINALSNEKDVDGLTDLNYGRFYKGSQAFIPCTARGVLELLKYSGEVLTGKSAVVIGRSNIVGKPVAALLMAENVTVTVGHSMTNNLQKVCKEADIIISAMGKPGFITSEFVKEGAIVIDVGTTMVEGKVKGDVLFDEVLKIAKYVSPVPGGVGAMTTTMLMKNTFDAWLKNV